MATCIVRLIGVLLQKEDVCASGLSGSASALPSRGQRDRTTWLQRHRPRRAETVTCRQWYVNITSNYRKIRLPCSPMAFVVPSIVEVLVNKAALWISICVNDWTAKRTIIASSALRFFRNTRTCQFYSGKKNNVCFQWFNLIMSVLLVILARP